MTESHRPGRSPSWRAVLAGLHAPASGRDRLAVALLTLAIGSAGGLLLYALAAPAAFLTGSALAISAAALARVPLHLPNPVRDASFAMMGMMMGTGVTPEGLADLASLPIAIAGLAVVLVGATLASYVVLRRVAGYGSLDAYLASVPGHFSLVMALAVSRDAHVEKVLVPQVMRLFILIVLVPMLLGGPESATFGAATPPAYGASEVALTVAIAFVSVVAASLLRLPAGTLIGPMVVSSVLSGTGLLVIAVPVWMGALAFIILGATIGVRFRAIRREGLRRMLVAALLSFAAAGVVAIAVSVAVAWALGESVGAMFLGYAPGGLDAMIALSFLLGFDVALVALLHTGRMLLLGFGAPLALPLFDRGPARLPARPE